MKRTFLFLMLGMLMISLASAEYLPHKQNTDLNFSITSNFATSCELTTINSPTGILTISQTDTSTGTFSFNVASGNFSSLGTYCMNIVCTDGSQTTSGQECRVVTGNGSSLPDGFLTAFFSILYIAFFAILIYLFVYSVGHFIKLDFDLLDLAYSFGSFFAYLTLFFLSKYYIGNTAIEDIMQLFLYPLGLLLLVVPLIMFVLSITVGALKPNQMTYGTRRLRRTKL